MELEGVTDVGPPVDDWPLLDELPEELAHILRQTNGLEACRGGLHLRGTCRAPAWQSPASTPAWCCSSASIPSIITG
jgi:hypothetical protein